MHERRRRGVVCRACSASWIGNDPTMVSVHADLLSRLEPRPCLPFSSTRRRFQENAADISERTVAYFRERVGFPISVATFRTSSWRPRLSTRPCSRALPKRATCSRARQPELCAPAVVGTAVPDLLVTSSATAVRDLCERRRSRSGSARCRCMSVQVARTALARRSRPPRRRRSSCRVIPHYNNAEGGTHDTRYCYMGERRLRMLEELLPDGVDVLGVDEHTAAIFDIDAATVTIRGRGGLTWRRKGVAALRERHDRAGRRARPRRGDGRR